MTAEKIVDIKVTEYKFNTKLFQFLPIEALKLKYFQNVSALLPMIFDYLNLAQDSDNLPLKSFQQVYHFQTDVRFKTGKLVVELGTVPLENLPNDMQLIIQPRLDADELNKFFKARNIRPWADVEKDIKGNKRWIDINALLQSALLLDTIFEFINKCKDDQLFGVVRKPDILQALKHDIATIDFCPKFAPYKDLYDIKAYGDNYVYFFNAKSNTTDNISDFEKHYAMEPFIYTDEANRTEQVLHYYYQLLEPKVNPNHKLYELNIKDFFYTNRNKAKEEASFKINKEYSLLYHQLPYLYMAKWASANSDAIPGETLPALPKIQPLNDSKNKVLSVTQLRELNIVDDITQHINENKLYKLHGKNFSLIEKLLYQIYYDKYICDICNKFRGKFQEFYNIRKQNSNENIVSSIKEDLLMEIFRLGYLIRHSYLLKLLHLNLLKELSLDAAALTDKAPALSSPSFFSIVFFFLLRYKQQCHNLTNNEQYLTEESEKYTKLVIAPLASITKNATKEDKLQFLDDALNKFFLIDPYYRNYAILPAKLIKFRLHPFLYIKDTTREWKRFNEELTNYYNSLNG